MLPKAIVEVFYRDIWARSGGGMPDSPPTWRWSAARWPTAAARSSISSTRTGRPSPCRLGAALFTLAADGRIADLWVLGDRQELEAQLEADAQGA